MLSVIMLSVIMLSVIMLKVVMLSVMAGKTLAYYAERLIKREVVLFHSHFFILHYQYRWDSFLGGTT